VLLAGAVAVSVAAVALAVTGRDPVPSLRGAAPEAKPTSTPNSTSTQPEGRKRASLTPADLQPWPSAAGACGNDASLPLLSVDQLHATTGLTALIGGGGRGGLRLVDVDTGAVRSVIAAGGAGRGSQVTGPAASQAGVHAVRVRCEHLLASGRDRAHRRPEATHGELFDAGAERCAAERP
jgi:hypothetical protein